MLALAALEVAYWPQWAEVNQHQEVVVVEEEVEQPAWVAWVVPYLLELWHSWVRPAVADHLPSDF